MKKTIIFVTILIALTIIGSLIFKYFRTTIEVTVNYSNANSVTIIDASNKTIATVKNSGQQIRLTKNKSYKAAFDASDNYQSGVKSFSSNDQSLTISPYYSITKLDTMLIAEKQSSQKALFAAYPLIPQLYTITSEKLYHYGDWYGATLIYKGNDIFNADNLKVVMYKSANKWQVISNPPSPTLNAYNSRANNDNPNSKSFSARNIIVAPADVLNDINS